MQIFGRNLRAATNYKITTGRPRDGEDRTRVWIGIDLSITSPIGAGQASTSAAF
jgi:hypothetical protein